MTARRVRPAPGRRFRAARGAVRWGNPTRGAQMPAKPAPSAARTTKPPPSMADFLVGLGGIPIERIRMIPFPGSATEADLEAAPKPTCELIDGTLVEKAMG